jgi:Type I phosphodiesterase / nucleotide pyrophosphatase
MAARAFLMVWDGLRPDLVSETLTPNLWRLAQEGVSFDRSYAVYPTLTRANSPAIATGCRPGRAGVPGNTFLLESNGSLGTFSTGDATNLGRLADADGQPVLLVDTLADRVHRAGGRTVVVGSGSPGCTWLQHPRAIECGDLVIGDGLPAMAGVMDPLRRRFGALPNRHAVPASAWTAYFTRVIADYVVPELDPTLLVFWHTDPDHTTHARGFGAPATVRALRDADANLAAIVDTYERHGLRGSSAIVVTSDHGGSTINRRVRPAQDLAIAAPNTAVAENGGSMFVYSSAEQVIAAIRDMDYAGPVFTRDGRDQTMPLSLVGLDGPRAPDIVFSLAWTDLEVDGYRGVAVGSVARLAVDHGTISPYDLRNTLVMVGADFKSAWRDPAPVGNIDICPTLAHVLGLEAGPPCDGRVLSEALVDGTGHVPEWELTESSTTFTARCRDWQQRVLFERVGATAYVAGGAVEAA